MGFDTEQLRNVFGFIVPAERLHFRKVREDRKMSLFYVDPQGGFGVKKKLLNARFAALSVRWRTSLAGRSQIHGDRK